MGKALNYLSLARKAGLAELGEEPVGAAARDGKAYLICVGLMKVREAETGHEQWIDTSSTKLRNIHHAWW